MSQFYGILKPIIDSVPKTKSANNGYPHWYSNELVDLIKRKQTAKANYKHSKKCNLDAVDDDHSIFANLRKAVKTGIVQCRLAYISDIEEKVDKNPKAFFSYTKSLHKSNSLTNQMQLDGVSADKNTNMCDLFASFFQSVYDPDLDGNYQLESYVDSVHTPALHITISTNDVQLALLNFDDCKVSTPDGIPMIFFKKLEEVRCILPARLSPV